jgi:hypothetical protein
VSIRVALASYLFDVEPLRRLRYDAGLARRSTIGLPKRQLAEQGAQQHEGGGTHQPAPCVAPPYDEENSDDPATAAHGPTNAAVMATLPTGRR